MVRSKTNWQEITSQIVLSILCASLMFALGTAIFNWYSHGWEFLRTNRTENFFIFHLSSLYVLILQSCFCLATRREWLSLLIFPFVVLFFQGTFAWLGPGDQAKAAENLLHFHIALTIGLIVLNILLCRIVNSLLPRPKKFSVPQQLKFEL